ncbi:MAG: TetR/AcrR family transcriptional regulator, partial [Myxococcota bacterium]
WRLGFDSASMAELEAAAGIDRRQLARDYGNKRGLFLQALEDYYEAAAARIFSRMEQPGAGLDAIEATLFALNEQSGRLGCFMCNTSVEPITQEDRDVRARVRAFYDRIEAAYFNALVNASKRDEITLRPPQLRTAARHLLTTHVGLMVLARNGTPPEVRSDAIRGALASLN